MGLGSDGTCTRSLSISMISIGAAGHSRALKVRQAGTRTAVVMRATYKAVFRKRSARVVMTATTATLRKMASDDSKGAEGMVGKACSAGWMTGSGGHGLTGE